MLPSHQNMHSYFCQKCPVAFEIGHSLKWDLDGFVDRLVCTSCGTMHELHFQKASPWSDDYHTGSSELFALPGRICTPEDLNGITDWKKVGDFQNRPSLESLTCNHCASQGRLISLEKPESKDGCWPIFRTKDGVFHCPLCGEIIDLISISF